MSKMNFGGEVVAVLLQANPVPLWELQVGGEPYDTVEDGELTEAVNELQEKLAI